MGEQLTQQLEPERSPSAIAEPRSAWYRYGAALVIMAVATLLRFWLDPVLDESGFAIFFAAVVLAAWLGGVGPCLLAQLLSLVISGAWFTETPDPTPESPAKFIAGLAAFFFVGIAAAVLSEANRAAQRRARSEAEEAVHQREQLRATLSCIGDAVVVTDEKGIITMMNPVAELLTAWPAADATGRLLETVFRVNREHLDAGNRDAAESPVRRVLEQRLITSGAAPLVLTARAGRPRPIDYTAAPIQDGSGRISGVVLIFRDETQRRQAESELRDADRRKDEFLALLAHELRNPMAPIANGLEILQMEEADDETRKYAFGIMHSQFEHLVRLVDDLLDVSRIARGKIELRPEQTPLGTIVQRAVEAARPLIDAQGHELTVDISQGPTIVNADPVRLAQVITNLLTNAAKYTDQGGKISLSARCDSQVVLRVRDTGIGIAPESLPKLFDMFMQVDPGLTRSRGGLGLGLTLVKSIVHMHGGEVEVHSEGLGCGSEFVVKLPLPGERTQSEQAPAALPAADTAPRRRILVVDDNVDAATSLAQLLRLKQHDVQIAHSGPEALQIVETARPDVMILDLGMPDMDGYQVAERVRGSQHGDSIVLVALTGWGGPEDRRRTQAAGFDHHFVKPLKLEQLSMVATLERNGVASEDGQVDGRPNTSGEPRSIT